MEENLQKYLSSRKETTSNVSGDQKSDVNCKPLFDNYHLLFGKLNDPAYLSVIKLDTLRLCVTEDNISSILEDIQSVLQRKYKESAVCDRIIAILLDLSKDSKFTDQSKQILTDLLNSTQVEILTSFLKFLHSISSYDDHIFESLFKLVVVKWRQLSSSDLAVLLHLIANFSHKQPETATYVTEITKYLLGGTTPNSAGLKSLLLHSVTECFIHQPAEYLETFKQCVSALEAEDDFIIQEQVKWCIGRVSKLLNN